jgi:hypothetical protein
MREDITGSLSIELRREPRVVVCARQGRFIKIGASALSLNQTGPGSPTAPPRSQIRAERNRFITRDRFNR